MRVVQISDTHITADPGDQTVIEMLGDIELVDSAATLDQVLADIAALDPPPDFVAATGDLGDRGHPASYRRLRSQLAALGVPVFAIPGNHDLPDAFDEHLPGGNVELGRCVAGADWTFLFARSGNTEWGELSRPHLDELARWAATGAGQVMLFVHHPPVSLHAGYLPDAGFLADDIAELAQRVPISLMAAGHVHGAHDVALGAIPLHTAPSTFMGANGPGYRIFDFTKDAYTTEVRSFPHLSAMNDEKRDKLMAALKPRIARMQAHTPVRDSEEHARGEVLEWQREADQRRGRAPRDQ